MFSVKLTSCGHEHAQLPACFDGLNAARRITIKQFKIEPDGNLTLAGLLTPTQNRANSAV
jgi:hypothetical protein